MKKAAVFYFFLCSIIYSLQAEEYKKLIESGKYFDIATQNGISVCRNTTFPKRYFFNGDTIIGGKIYHKVWNYRFKPVDKLNSYCPPYVVDTAAYQTNILLREDTVERKVYRYYSDDKLEYLLFDFNLSVGDTIPYRSPEFTNSEKVMVDSVEFIVTNDGKTRRKFYVSEEYNKFGAYYIEGIGSDNGPFLLPTIILAEGWHYLMSVSNKKYNIYGATYPFVNEAYNNYFPTSDAIWNTHILGSTGNYHDNQIYGIKGDTMISGNLYHKVYILSDTVVEDSHDNTYLGALLKDDKKVWFKPQTWVGEDILLYDFGVAVRDTIWHNAYARIHSGSSISFMPADNYSIVTYIEPNSETYYYINSGIYPGQKWNSKFGSTHGLFGSIIDMPLPGDKYELACFKHNNTVKYLNNAKCDVCFCKSLGVEMDLLSEQKITISPNPAVDYINLTIDRPYKSLKVELLNVQGQQLLTNQMQTQISIPLHLHGICFVKITVDGNVMVSKLLVK